MPPVQLSRLRPQVNALMSHYQDQDLFAKTLRRLLEKYSEKQNSANAWLRFDPGLPAYYASPVVMNELESALELLAKTQPGQCVPLAETMWREAYYEPKKLAVFLLARLGPPWHLEFIRHIESWFAEGMNEALTAEIIQQSSQKLEIISSREWFSLLESWIMAGDKQLQKTGIQAVECLLANRAFHNLPLVFNLVAPLYSQPRITLQKDMQELTRALIERTQPETASFLIAMVELNRKENVAALVRKLLPLFDEYYREEVRKAVV
jgi:hypothetical protein